ncbi:tyrosine-type recombinase/integrase [Pseudomonas sp. PD9R]|uniref:tyrosine-type recombinase/integrase n=1 Tax=Pseudomonas sp. PD9R TaxID=2853534 RepID=UPI0035258ACD
MRCRRDATLLLIGFWRGFRGVELARLKWKIPRRKPASASPFTCPIPKGIATIKAAPITPLPSRSCAQSGRISTGSPWLASPRPDFSKARSGGNLSESTSLIPLLRRILEDADIPARVYSSHSMRRGFATWASANGWDIKGLMSYVGWKDMKSALRYVDARNSFGGLAAHNTGEIELDR